MNAESITQLGLVAVVALAGLTMIRTFWARSKVSEAGAEHAMTNTNATTQLFAHYQKELNDLRARIDDCASRLACAEKELASMEEMYKQSAAGERRYRYAFAKLLQVTSMLMEEARDYVPSDRLKVVESEITRLITALSRPLDATSPDPEVDVFVK